LGDWRRRYQSLRHVCDCGVCSGSSSNLADIQQQKTRLRRNRQDYVAVRAIRRSPAELFARIFYPNDGLIVELPACQGELVPEGSSTLFTVLNPYCSFSCLTRKFD